MVKRYLIILAGLLFMLSGCGKAAGKEVEQEPVSGQTSAQEEQEPEDRKTVVPERDPNQTILFIFNYTEINCDMGYFVDVDGAKHYFDLTDKDHLSIGEKYQYLNDHISEYEAEEFLSPEELEQCYEYLWNIEAEAEKEHFFQYHDEVGATATLYGVRMENAVPEFVFIRGNGCTLDLVTEENTRKTIEILGQDWKQYEKE